MKVVSFDTFNDRERAGMLLNDFEVAYQRMAVKKKLFKKMPEQIVVSSEDITRVIHLLTGHGVKFHIE